MNEDEWKLFRRGKLSRVLTLYGQNDKSKAFKKFRKIFYATPKEVYLSDIGYKPKDYKDIYNFIKKVFNVDFPEENKVTLESIMDVIEALYAVKEGIA